MRAPTASSGSRVSAFRNRSTLPQASSAAWLSCRARFRAARTQPQGMWEDRNQGIHARAGITGAPVVNDPYLDTPVHVTHTIQGPADHACLVISGDNDADHSQAERALALTWAVIWAGGKSTGR